MSNSTKIAQLYPGRIVMIAFVALITLGTVALSLPIAQKQAIPLIDTLLMSTSSACVTGMFSAPISALTRFGQIVVLLLIQIGGLGVVTLTLFLMSLVTNLGLSTQLIAGQILDLGTWKDVKKILVHIVVFTFFCEVVGAFAIYACIAHRYPPSDALFIAIFQSISSFCNAGISLLTSHSELLPIGSNPLLLIITTLLMLMGSFGFIVFIDLLNQLKTWQKRKRLQLSLTSKLVLQAHAILITVGTTLFFLLEHNNAFKKGSTGLALLNALFMSISLRSTGFMTQPLGAFKSATLFLIFPLSFIGSAPGSTASGVKITTISLVLATIWAAIKGAKAVNIYGRKVHTDQIFKSLAIVFIGITWILLAIFILLSGDPQISFWQGCLEAVSAFTNVGITQQGTTAMLSACSKLTLILSMLVGRVGPLTLVSALRRLSTIKKTQRSDEVVYPKERIMLS